MSVLDIAWNGRLVLAYIEVLRWPVVVLALVVLFRNRLHELFGRVTQAEGPGFKAQFAEVKAKAEAEFQEHVTGELVATLGDDTMVATGRVENPKRDDSFTLKVSAFPDLVDAFRLLATFDEVVMDISPMHEIAQSGAGMWALGLQMGTRGLPERP